MLYLHEYILKKWRGENRLFNLFIMLELFFIKKVIVEKFIPYTIFFVSVGYIIFELIFPSNIREYFYSYSDKLYFKIVIRTIQKIKNILIKSRMKFKSMLKTRALNLEKKKEQKKINAKEKSKKKLKRKIDKMNKKASKRAGRKSNKKNSRTANKKVNGKNGRKVS